MKAAPFDYVRADSLEHALAELDDHGGDAKLLAGGQSLVPMMSMRLVRPARLIDIHQLTELQQISLAESCLRIGAAVRQCTLERDEQVARSLPLVARGLQWVGHQQTRNRGTMGGSLVHADPSAEQALCAVVLGARLVLKSRSGGVRHVNADAFFLGPMFTAVAENECLVEIEWPLWSEYGVGCAFEEIAIRHGDFAIASAAAQVEISGDGVCTRAALGAGGVDGVPLSFETIVEHLIGQVPSHEMARSIADEAAKACEPGNDIHADAEYRRHLVRVLVYRVLMQAIERTGSALT